MTRPDLDAILPPVSTEDESTVDALLAKAREGTGKRPIGSRPDLDAIRARIGVAHREHPPCASEDVTTLLVYVDELERRTAYTVGETEWAQRIAVAEQRFADEHDAHQETRTLLTDLYMKQLRADAAQMREYGLSYEGVRKVLHEYNDGEISFGKLMDLIRAAARAMAEDMQK